jgi:alpha-L-fucosidase
VNYTAEDFRFTTKGDVLFAIELGWPSTGEAVVRSLASGTAGTKKVASVSLLGVDGTLKSRQQKDGLHIEVPATAPGGIAHAFRIVFESGT